MNHQFSHVTRDEHHKGKLDIPATKVGDEGSAKRNIQRKHDHDPHRKEKKQGGGKCGSDRKWDPLLWLSQTVVTCINRRWYVRISTVLMGLTVWF